MRWAKVYVDLDGNQISLEHLDAEERKLLNRIQRRARTHQDWDAFDNYWTREVRRFYDARGMSRTTNCSRWRGKGGCRNA